MVRHFAATTKRRNSQHKNYKYQPVNETKRSTLWAACRAVVFGTAVILVGILMTLLGYFDVYLSQEIVRSARDGVEEVSINWTKRYLLKSLQYLGPIVMGIGSFILIIACVITLESRDKNTQILHDVKEGKSCGKKKSGLREEAVEIRLPLTDDEIRDWTPRYKAVPLTRFGSSPLLNRRRKWQSTPCIPQSLLDTIDTRKLYERLLDNCDYGGAPYTENDAVPEPEEHGRACTSTSEQHEPSSSVRQNVIAEVHNPPPALLLSSLPSPRSWRVPSWYSQQHQSSSHLSSSSTANFRRSDHAFIENYSSNNIIFTIDIDATTTATTTTTTTTATTPTFITTAARTATTIAATVTMPHRILEETERRAPLASLDIEFRTSSTSSSPNVNFIDAESFFAIVGVKQINESTERSRWERCSRFCMHDASDQLCAYST